MYRLRIAEQPPFGVGDDVLVAFLLAAGQFSAHQAHGLDDFVLAHFAKDCAKLKVGVLLPGAAIGIGWHHVCDYLKDWAGIRRGTRSRLALRQSAMSGRLANLEKVPTATDDGRQSAVVARCPIQGTGELVKKVERRSRIPSLRVLSNRRCTKTVIRQQE